MGGSGGHGRKPHRGQALELRFVERSCVVARRGEAFSCLIMVDYPSAFVIMPFREKWSTTVSKF
jgi:hypothetical protein